MSPKEEYVFGLRFELEYDYLKTTDLAWVFSTLRSELVHFLIEQELMSRSELRGKRIAFQLTQAQSGGSITIDIFPLVGDGPSWTLSLSISIPFLLRELHRWWSSRAGRQADRIPPFGVGRRNIRRFRTREIRKRFRPDGTLSSETLVEAEEEQVEWK